MCSSLCHCNLKLMSHPELVVLLQLKQNGQPFRKTCKSYNSCSRSSSRVASGLLKQMRSFHNALETSEGGLVSVSCHAWTRGEIENHNCLSLLCCPQSMLGAIFWFCLFLSAWWKFDWHWVSFGMMLGSGSNRSLKSHLVVSNFRCKNLWLMFKWVLLPLVEQVQQSQQW